MNWALLNFGCELLSNFLYFCSRNNKMSPTESLSIVVNCSQIFCTFAVETTVPKPSNSGVRCELLSNFLYFCSRNNYWSVLMVVLMVVNCSQIFCTFAVETTHLFCYCTAYRCELLSNFLYFCSRNNSLLYSISWRCVVNCSQIFCTFAVETTKLEITIVSLCCELLSNFLYFCSRNNHQALRLLLAAVVNCSQIFCTFAVETTWEQSNKRGNLL